MDETEQAGTDRSDHTVDSGVLPTPAPVEYETAEPKGKVETFHTGVILVIR